MTKKKTTEKEAKRRQARSPDGRIADKFTQSAQTICRMRRAPAGAKLEASRMSNPLEVSSTTIARLQKHAKPFVDTVDSVINRILDHYENSLGQKSDDESDISAIGSIRDFDPESPPDLTHTKLLSVDFNKRGFSRSDTTWNAFLNEAICLAKRNTKSDEQLKRLVLVNFVKGKKENEGYRYLADADLSVQGQDANAAWKAAYHIARQLQAPFEIIFTWRTKDGAAHPGVTGRFKPKPRARFI